MARWIRELAERVLPLCGVEASGFPNSYHLAYYPGAGAIVGWHADSEELFGPPLDLGRLCPCRAATPAPSGIAGRMKRNGLATP